MNTTQKTLYIILATLKEVEVKNNSLLAKLTDVFSNFKDKYFANNKTYFFKPMANGMLVTGHDLLDIAEKALLLRDEIKNYNWTSLGFTEALSLGIALHTGEAFEHYDIDESIQEVSGRTITQTIDLQSFTIAGEVFCSMTYAELLKQENKAHHLASISLGKYNLGKLSDKFDMAISLLFRQNNREVYEEYKANKVKKYLAKKTETKDVKTSDVMTEQKQNISGQTTIIHKTYHIASIENANFDKSESAQKTNISNTQEPDLDRFKQELLGLIDEGEYQQVFDKIKKGTYNYNKFLLNRLQKQFSFSVTLDLIEQLKVFVGSLN